MSGLDKWESDSKKAAGGLGITLLAVVMYAGKKILEELKAQSAEENFRKKRR